MKVFISWSGKRSHAVAELLSDWVKCVLQATTPWISSRDIDRGALWFSEIGDQLKDTTVGIICVTQENKERPWILFEAGALAKGLSSSRVCTFLVDLDPSDLEDPLAQFNHTKPEKSDMLKLVNTLNRALGGSQLEQRVLDQVFETYWPQFELQFFKAIDDNPVGEVPTPRTEESMIQEILENTRSLNKRVNQLETTTFKVNNGFQSHDSSKWRQQAIDWMQGGRLKKFVNGQDVFVIKAQDTPPLPVEIEIESLVREAHGDNVRVVYRGIPSQ